MIINEEVPVDQGPEPPLEVHSVQLEAVLAVFIRRENAGNNGRN